MKHLGISGGGTKIAGLFGAVEALILEKGFRPHVISGISAGSILALPIALGKFNEVRDLVLDMKLNDFFSSPPVKQNGKFTMSALWRIISGKPYLGKQEALEDKLRSIISKDEFLAYQNDPSKADCIVGAVDFITGSRKFFNLKQVSYDDFPKVVNASSSLPIFTTGIKMRVDNEDVYLYDGGVRDHIASAYIIDESDFKDDIRESVSIFSRPEDFKVLPKEFNDKNVIAILSRYVDITNVEISKNDEYYLDKLCKEKDIRNLKFYLPRVLDSVYDTDPKRLKEIYLAGMQEGRKYLPESVLV